MRLLGRAFIVVVCVAIVIACGADRRLTFDFALARCYDAVSKTHIEGLVTVTNGGSSTVRYQLPVLLGYEAADASGKVVARQDASAVSITLPTPDQWTVTLQPGSSTKYAVVDLPWYFSMPVNPSDLGDPNAPLQAVPPGVYRVAVLLLNGDRTNSATVTVCDGEPAVPRYGVCNSPCLSETLAAEQGMTPTSCGTSLTCSP